MTIIDSTQSICFTKSLDFIQELYLTSLEEDNPLEHFCIDSNPLAEVILRMGLYRLNLYIEEVGKIYGYRVKKPLRGQNLNYFFVNKIQHIYLQKQLGTNQPCAIKK